MKAFSTEGVCKTKMRASSEFLFCLTLLLIYIVTSLEITFLGWMPRNQLKSESEWTQGMLVERTKERKLSVSLSINASLSEMSSIVCLSLCLINKIADRIHYQLTRAASRAHCFWCRRAAACSRRSLCCRVCQTVSTRRSSQRVHRFFICGRASAVTRKEASWKRSEAAEPSHSAETLSSPPISHLWRCLRSDPDWKQARMSADWWRAA